MNSYPEKPKKRKSQTEVEQFDKSKLTPSDHELLMAFRERREKFEHLIEKSNILYHKKTCPGCGYPTIDEDEFYMTCPICLWEGYSPDKSDTYQGPPNYISLIEHRINISRFLQLFNATHTIDDSIEKITASIKHFEQSTVGIDRNNFENNLKNILPTKPK